jgi:hypothetical protein
MATTTETDPGRPQECDLTRVRGDTFPIRFQIDDEAGVPIDITSYEFLLTVDPQPDPANADNNLFELTGTIDDGPAGEFSFAPSTLQADQTPNTYYYDVQMKDTASAIRTIITGKWIVPQDITKST